MNAVAGGDSRAEAPLRVLIVDDEPLARLRLQQLLSQCTEPRVEVVGEAGHASQAIGWLERQTVDAVLLDIRMPGEDGLQLATRLRALPRPPAVVFVTAHAAHALQAFDLQALDYLTKPVHLARLQQALRRVAAIRMPVPAGAVGDADASPQVLVIQERQRMLRIPLDDIVMLQAGQKRVSLITLTREYLLDEPLADLEQRLGPRFLRVHRSTVVARHAARALVRRLGAGGEEAWYLQVMPGDHWVPVSRRLVGPVRDALAQR